MNWVHILRRVPFQRSIQDDSAIRYCRAVCHDPPCAAPPLLASPQTLRVGDDAWGESFSAPASPAHAGVSSGWLRLASAGDAGMRRGYGLWDRDHSPPM